MRTLKTFYFAVGFSMQCFVNIQAQTNDELSAKLISPVAENHWTIYFKDPKEGESPVVWHADRETNLKKSIPTPFGQHSTGQNIEQLEKELGIEGKILNILDAMNAIHVKVSAEEILKLRNRSDVEAVEPVMISFLDSTQSNPKWALDRIDEPYPDTPDNSYNFSYSGSGQTVYVLDSGLDVGDSFVTAEFGSRASMLYDFNGSTGEDTVGHGTAVASVVAGNTFGVAKDANIIMVKVTDGGDVPPYLSSIAI